MRHSDQLDQIATALHKAQGEIAPAAMTKTNPHFKSRYASLGDVWEACKEALQRNGLSVFQTAESGDNGSISVVTMILHTSGQYVSGEFRMPLDKANAQGAGSAITYGRRYGLAAAIGIVNDEDDDGNGASQPQAPRPPQRSEARPAPQRAAPRPPSSGQWDALPFGKQWKGTPNRELPDQELLDAYGWALSKGKYTEWQECALAEIQSRGLRI